MLPIAWALFVFCNTAGGVVVRAFSDRAVPDLVPRHVGGVALAHAERWDGRSASRSSASALGPATSRAMTSLIATRRAGRRAARCSRCRKPISQELEAISHDEDEPDPTAAASDPTSRAADGDRPRTSGVVDRRGRELRVLPGHPLPFGVTETRRGLNFAVFSSHATAMTLVLFAPPPRRARCSSCRSIATVASHRPRLARRARRASTAARATAGAPTATGAAATRCIASTQRDVLIDPYATALTGGSRWGASSRATASRTRPAAAPALARTSAPVRLGRHAAAAHPARGQGHLRAARARLHAPPVGRRRASRHVPRADREDPVSAASSASPRSSCCRCTSSTSSRTRNVNPAHRRAAATTSGATARSASSRPRRRTPSTAATARRSPSSRPWCASSTAPASRCSSTSSSTTPPRAPLPPGAPSLSFRGLDNAVYYLVDPDDRRVSRLLRLREHAQLQPPGGAQPDHRRAALLGGGDARRRLPLRPRLDPRPRPRRRGAGQPAGARAHRRRSGARRRDADRRGVGRGRPLPGRHLSRLGPLGGMERPLPRRRPPLRARRPRLHRRARRRASPAAPISSSTPAARRRTRSTSSPATTASRSPIWSRTTASTTSPTARTTATVIDDNVSWNCGVEGPTDDPAVRALRAPPDAQLPHPAAARAGHADAARRRRARPHPARQQQRLLPGQRDQLGRLDAARDAIATCSASPRR